jgi:hypothetical protein
MPAMPRALRTGAPRRTSGGTRSVMATEFYMSFPAAYESVPTDSDIRAPWVKPTTKRLAHGTKNEQNTAGQNRTMAY